MEFENGHIMFVLFFIKSSAPQAEEKNYRDAFCNFITISSIATVLVPRFVILIWCIFKTQTNCTYLIINLVVIISDR